MLFNNQKHVTLKELLAKGPVMLPNVFDCVSAKTMELVGFEALNLPAADVAASLVGFPDVGLIDFDEINGVVDRMYNMSPLPIVADIHCGFGNEINVLRSCERIKKAGASAIVFDDTKFQPSYVDGVVVETREEFLSKLRAALYVVKGSDVMLIAKTYAYKTKNIDEAIARCNMAIEAGADATFVEGVDNMEDLKKIASQVKGHKMFEMREKKVATYDELVALGFDLIAMEFAMAGANEYMWESGLHSKEDMSDIYSVEHSILPSGKQSTALGNHEMFGANNWLGLGASFSDHSELKFAGEFIPKDGNHR